MSDMRPNKEQIEDLRQDAKLTARIVGAPGCLVRQRAEWLLALLDEREALVTVAAKARAYMLAAPGIAEARARGELGGALYVVSAE